MPPSNSRQLPSSVASRLRKQGKKENGNKIKGLDVQRAVSSLPVEATGKAAPKEAQGKNKKRERSEEGISIKGTTINSSQCATGLAFHSSPQTSRHNTPLHGGLLSLCFTFTPRTLSSRLRAWPFNKEKLVPDIQELQSYGGFVGQGQGAARGGLTREV